MSFESVIYVNIRRNSGHRGILFSKALSELLLKWVARTHLINAAGTLFLFWKSRDQPDLVRSNPGSSEVLLVPGPTKQEV